jgi:hypothetical protein
MILQDIRDEGIREAAKPVIEAFESVIGASNVEFRLDDAGPHTFLKFIVGRPSPLYDYALREVQRRIPQDNIFLGLIGLDFLPPERLPASVEASALSTLLTRATRPVAQGRRPEGYVVPYVPFQNREDHRVAQPATQLIVGRRGVEKSTLITRALELLATGKDVTVVLDMQAYSELTGTPLYREVIIDLVRMLRPAIEDAAKRSSTTINLTELSAPSSKLTSADFDINTAAPSLRRILTDISTSTNGQFYVFLDDFHLIDRASQPTLLNIVHGAFKGANGWLKVAGLGSLLNYYDPATRKGLQVPGDAQLVSLDLTLENPLAAEKHLAAILESFMRALGFSGYASVLPQAAFRRLVWANAGVPRDFLQMFARALEHARKNQHATVTLSDINVSIGEFGQEKLDGMQQDARNQEGRLRAILDYLSAICLDKESVNAFLVRTERTEERATIQTLSDLRLVHVIHQSITPDRAGETYEAFILDYSLFTGFRRRPNIREMLPEEGHQFRASALRQLPKLSAGFTQTLGPAQKDERLEGYTNSSLNHQDNSANARRQRPKFQQSSRPIRSAKSTRAGVSKKKQPKKPITGKPRSVRRRK